MEDSGTKFPEVLTLGLHPIQAENHNYTYDMDSGLGWIKAFCMEDGSFCMFLSSHNPLRTETDRVKRADVQWDTNLEMLKSFVKDTCGDCGGSDEALEVVSL